MIGTWRSTPQLLRRYLSASGYDLDKTDSTVADQGMGVAVDAQDNIYVAGRINITDNYVGIGSTAFLTSWTSAGVQKFMIPIPNKSSCTSGGNTNGWSVTFDGSGGLWFLGNHCDYEIILRQYDPTNGALLINADLNTTPDNINLQEKIASDGTTLAVVGDGTWSAGEDGFQLTDTDLQGNPIRKFSLALNPQPYDRLSGVAFLGHDRIVVGTDTTTTGTPVTRIWVARLRAP